jgi:hypothetical protein
MIDTTQRPAAVRRYFTPTPSTSKLVIAAVATSLGLVFWIYSVAGPGKAFSGLLGFVGTIWGGVGLIRYYLAYTRSMPKPSEEQMQGWLEMDVTQVVVPRARQRLSLEGVNLSTEHRIAVGPYDNAKIRITRGRLRADWYKVVVLFLTDYHLSGYECVLDFYHGRIHSDSTSEYHYNDVVAVNSVSVPISSGRTTYKVITEDDAVRLTNRQEFQLIVSSGDRIGVTTEVTGVSGGDAGSGGKVPWAANDDLLRVVQMTLREKKRDERRRTEIAE